MNDQLQHFTLTQHFIDHELEKMPGWCWKEKATAMTDLILRTNPVIVVEIGVFGGRSLIPQALALRETSIRGGGGMIFGIDAWSNQAAIEGVNDPANDEWWKKVDMEQIYETCKNWVTKKNLSGICHLIRSPSELAVSMFLDDAVDILHIDGAHSELVSCRDAQLYLPKVRKGGYVWFDDVNWNTTKKAQEIVAEQCDKQMDILSSLGSCSLFQKR